MPQMTAVQVTRPGAPFEVVKRSIPEPATDQVRIQVQACGICHSDAFVKEGHWPGLEYPRVTGHEIAGVIDGIGPHVTAWRKGQYVGEDGTEGTAVSVWPVGAAISSPVNACL